MFATILGRRLSILRLFIACKSIKTSVLIEFSKAGIFWGRNYWLGRYCQTYFIVTCPKWYPAQSGTLHSHLPKVVFLHPGPPKSTDLVYTPQNFWLGGHSNQLLVSKCSIGHHMMFVVLCREHKYLSFNRLAVQN